MLISFKDTTHLLHFAVTNALCLKFVHTLCHLRGHIPNVGVLYHGFVWMTQFNNFAFERCDLWSFLEFVYLFSKISVLSRHVLKLFVCSLCSSLDCRLVLSMPLSHFSRTAMHCCRNFFHCMCFCMYKFVIFESIRFRLLGIFVVSGAWRRWLKSLKWSFCHPFPLVSSLLKT